MVFCHIEKNNQHQTALKKDLQKTYNEDLNKRVFKKLGHLMLKIKEKKQGYFMNKKQ